MVQHCNQARPRLSLALQVYLTAAGAMNVPSTYGYILNTCQAAWLTFQVIAY